MCKFKYAPMVKWLRRRPLTAESRVRFPMGVPRKNCRVCCSIFCCQKMQRFYARNFFYTDQTRNVRSAFRSVLSCEEDATKMIGLLQVRGISN